MTMKYVIDTHALIWFLEGNARLGETAKVILANSASELILPAIALAEAVWIVERCKTGVPSVRALLSVSSGDSRISVHALDKAVVEQSVALCTVNEMHDRQIVATTLVLQNRGESVALLTCDQNITASGLVTIIW